MPNPEHLIHLLSGVPVNARRPSQPGIVAGHLVKSVLSERWLGLSERRRQQLIKSSAARLFRVYIENLKREYAHKEAAIEAIEDELNTLEQILTTPTK